MKIYDLLVIGGGFSSVSFLSEFIKNGFEGSIALLEAGRKLGGRCSLKNSRRSNLWDIHHGSPNFNIQKNTSNTALNDFIKDLVINELIVLDDSFHFELDRDFKMLSVSNNEFYIGNIYRALVSMSDLLAKKIKLIDPLGNIDTFFSTLVTDLEFINDKWILYTKSGEVFETKFLILSSNLILHKRSRQIFSVDNIPMEIVARKTRSKHISKLIKEVNKQNYIKRKNYILYTNKSYNFKALKSLKDIHFTFQKEAEREIGIERIVFNKQKNNNISIVLHTKDVDVDKPLRKYSENKEFKDLVQRFNKIFINNKYINQLHEYDAISTMIWRASQPVGKRISNELQLCKESNIGFCGDWFDCNGFGRVEGAILSGLLLAKKLKSHF